MRRRLADERGFTLVEMLTAMTVGIVVIGAAFVLIQQATALNATTQDRVDAAQRGRTGLEAMTTDLRSQTCVTASDGTPARTPLIAGTATQVDFYGKTGAPDAVPQKRRLTFANGAVTETTWDLLPPTTGKPVGSVDFARGTGAPRVRTLLADVGQVDSNTPVFRYWAYNAASLTTPPLVEQEVAAPLAAASLTKVLWIEVDLRVRPTGAGADSPKDAIFKNRVYFRLGDPNDPTKGVQCL